MDYDFSFFLVVSSLISGVIWGAYLLYLKFTEQAFDEENEPIIVEYSRSFFPILFIVLILRSFIVEPFRIPSGSMMPTLLVGDFILVNKFSYGVKLPVLNNTVINSGKPERGDIAVFRFPKDPTVDYIKRVVGVPGDRVTYYDKKLFINGDFADQQSLGRYQGVGQGSNMTGADHIIENLTGIEHHILVNRNRPSEQGIYTVPDGHYFVMGDNRDNSNDSRYWGMVPEANLVGKAFFIWMSWDWQHKGIGLDRIGTILQ